MNKLRLVNQYTYQDIFHAYMECRKEKRNSRSAIAFEVRFEKNLEQLLDEVNSGTYQIGRSEVFVVEWPKPREIWSALFRDRIVHHLVCRDITGYFEARFIEDTFSCIKGRGTLAASNRLVDLHRKITQNYARDCWYLQVDVKNFFVSIDKRTLWGFLEKTIGNDTLTSRLMKQIVFNDPTANPVIKPNSRFHLVPRHKSLWHTPTDVGLAIGNLPSQFNSNVYMDPFDKFMKHALGARNYVRYVDDAVILSTDREWLEGLIPKMEQFLLRRLKLELHPNKTKLERASQGINFVGYIVKPHRRYTRRTTVSSAKNAASRARAADLSSVNSYLGIMRHSASRNIRKEICTITALRSGASFDSNFTKVFNPKVNECTESQKTESCSATLSTMTKPDSPEWLLA